MFVVKINGKTAAVTNSLESAASYVGGVKDTGHRITIISLLPEDLEPAVHDLLSQHKEVETSLPKAA